MNIGIVVKKIDDYTVLVLDQYSGEEVVCNVPVPSFSDPVKNQEHFNFIKPGIMCVFVKTSTVIVNETNGFVVSFYNKSKEAPAIENEVFLKEKESVMEYQRYNPTSYSVKNKNGSYSKVMDEFYLFLDSVNKSVKSKLNSIYFSTKDIIIGLYENGFNFRSDRIDAASKEAYSFGIKTHEQTNGGIVEIYASDKKNKFFSFGIKKRKINIKCEKDVVLESESGELSITLSEKDKKIVVNGFTIYVKKDSLYINSEKTDQRIALHKEQLEVITGENGIFIDKKGIMTLQSSKDINIISDNSVNIEAKNLNIKSTNLKIDSNSFKSYSGKTEINSNSTMKINGSKTDIGDSSYSVSPKNLQKLLKSVIKTYNAHNHTSVPAGGPTSPANTGPTTTAAMELINTEIEASMLNSSVIEKDSVQKINKKNPKEI